MLRVDPQGFDVDSALAHYAEHGYARLGVLLDEAGLAALRERADDLMLGRVSYPGLFFQMDAPTGRYEDAPLGLGWQGPSLDYRKLEKLELDPRFRAWLENPLFERITRAAIPGDIVLYRAILFHKGEAGGSNLPWHQDGGRLWGLTQEPELQLWTALDDAPEDGGCLEVVPGSHRGGLVTPLGGVIPPDRVEAAGAESRRLLLPARAGEVMLVHNHVWHRSGPSRTGQRRRAFSVCYMSASTRCVRKKKAPRVFMPVFRHSPGNPGPEPSGREVMLPPVSGTPGVLVAEQPHYLPWLDFYEQVARADTLLILDNVQWLRRGWQRRTRVALPHHVPTPPPSEPGFQWLTIPLEGAHRDSLLSELAVDASQPWARKHLQALTTLYGGRPYFRGQVLPRLEPFYAEAAQARGPGSLLRTLLSSMALFYEPLGLTPRVRLASTLDRSHPDKTGRLASYCVQLGADTYYSGTGSTLYLQPAMFREAGVRLLWQRFRYPPYPQGREGRFVQGLSIVDVLSNAPVEQVREWLKPSPWGPFAPPAG